MPEDMRQETEAIYRCVAFGERPDPATGAKKRKVYNAADGLAGVHGGSANHGWFGWLLTLLVGDSAAREYYITRLRHELREGLGGGEQLAWTYGDLHLGSVSIAWWWAWREGDAELAGLAGAWIERWLLVQCLCGRRTKAGLEFLAPGMRRDHGGDRATEEAMACHLLGLPSKFRDSTEVRSGWTAGWLLAAMRAANGIEHVLDRVRFDCLPLPRRLSQVALYVPIVVYGEPLTPARDWVAVMQCRGWCHPQDPPCLAGGVIQGNPVELFPWKPGEDPGEGGWSAEVSRVGAAFNGRWSRQGQTFTATIPWAPSEPTLTIHQPTADPLDDLPALPEGRPQRRPPGSGGSTPASPPEPARPRPGKPAPAPPAEPGPNAPPKAGGEGLEDLRRDALALRAHVPGARWTAIVDRLMQAAGVAT